MRWQCSVYFVDNDEGIGMPLYDYVCDTCHHRFERRHGFNETVTECPECGKSVRKVLHAAGVVFKGSGWYITDTRKGESESSSSSSSSSEKKSESTTPADSSTTKTETKSDSAPADSKPAESKSSAAAAG